MLNKVLNQILNGKYYYNSSNMIDKMAETDIKLGKTSKYLKGIDFKELLL